MHGGIGVDFTLTDRLFKRFKEQLKSEPNNVLRSYRAVRASKVEYD